MVSFIENRVSRHIVLPFLKSLTMKTLPVILCFGALSSFGQTPKLVLPIGHIDYVSSAHFSSDGKLVVTGAADKTAKIWEANSGRLLHSLEGHTRDLTTTQFSPDAKFIVTASKDETGKIWETRTGLLLHTLDAHSVQSARYSNNGKLIVTTGYHGANIRRYFNDVGIIVWDASSGKELKSLVGHSIYEIINSARFSADDKYIVTASDDSTARVWNVSTGKLLHTLEGHAEEIGYAEFSSDNKYIVTASIHDIKIWNANTGKLLRSLDDPNIKLSDSRWNPEFAKFSPDGKYLAVYTEVENNNLITIWETNSGNKFKSIKLQEIIKGFQFSYDNQYISTSHSDQYTKIYQAKIWSVNTGELVNTFNAPDYLGDVEFSRDGKNILVTSGEETANIWDVTIGRLTRLVHGHANAFTTAKFNPDGQSIATFARYYPPNYGRQIQAN